MQSQTIARAIAPAAAIIMAGVAIMLLRTPSDELARSFAHPAPQVEDPAPAPPADVEPATPSSDAAAAAKAQELEAMSETFRNTTFVTAIRDAGFTCYELLRVYGGVDGSAKWMATCSEMHAYTVSVAATGTLQVAPVLQYFDGMTPRIDRTNGDPTQVLPPQPRLPQRLPEQR